MTIVRFLLGCCVQIILAAIVGATAAVVAYSLTDAIQQRQQAQGACYAL